MSISCSNVAEGLPLNCHLSVLKSARYHFYVVKKFGAMAEEISLDASNGDERGTVGSHQWEMPSLEFENLWETLVFDEPIKNELLVYINSLLEISRAGADQSILPLNRLILLHGPPGTGKTTLCKALAQKLAIRTQKQYKRAVLVEVNSHSLFSKWFSESGKLVQKLFTRIEELAEQPNWLVFVLIDEVERLCRQGEWSSALGWALQMSSNELTIHVSRRILEGAISSDRIGQMRVFEALDDKFLNCSELILLYKFYTFKRLVVEGELRQAVHILHELFIDNSSPMEFHAVLFEEMIRILCSFQQPLIGLDTDSENTTAPGLDRELVQDMFRALSMLHLQQQLLTTTASGASNGDKTKGGMQRINLVGSSAIAADNSESEQRSEKLTQLASFCANSACSGRSLRKLPVLAYAAARSGGCDLSTVIGPCLENTCPAGYVCDLTSQVCCMPKAGNGCKKRKRRNVWGDKGTAEETLGGERDE
uniref:Nuclear pore complex protein Nup85 n=1 Tax=Globodera pallida TaxID=36090 RepID=A0A183C9I0_GLOPA